jgi:hypothetical protein
MYRHTLSCSTDLTFLSWHTIKFRQIWIAHVHRIFLSIINSISLWTSEPTNSAFFHLSHKWDLTTSCLWTISLRNPIMAALFVELNGMFAQIQVAIYLQPNIHHTPKSLPRRSLWILIMSVASGLLLPTVVS